MTPFDEMLWKFFNAGARAVNDNPNLSFSEGKAIFEEMREEMHA